MPVTNTTSGTRIDEIAEGIYRISTPVPPTATDIPGGFTFNQFLVVDDAPLLFHTGMRSLFPLVREAVATVLAPERIRWLSYSHVEADENGALEDWLAIAPEAQPLVGRMGAMLGESSRPARALADGERLVLGRHEVTWFDAPHLPHGWDCGFLGELTTGTLFCGDLFTQPGAEVAPVTDGDILGPSEAMRAGMDYYALGPTTAPSMEKLVAFAPRVLACMHGSSWRGDGAAMLAQLRDRLLASR